MEVFTLVFIAVSVLKIISIIQAIRWLRSRGKDYADRLGRNSPTKEYDYFDALEDCGGSHFPFGVKDYRLRKFIIQGEKTGILWQITALIASAFQATLYRYERLSFLVGLWAVITVSMKNYSLWFISSATHNILLFTLTTIVLGTNSLLSIEAVYSYALLGGYAIPFHRIIHRNGNRLLVELRVVAGMVVTTVFTGAVAAYVAYTAFAGLEGKVLAINPTANFIESIAAFFQMIYWATTTFATVGYGDIYPANGYGQFVAFLIEVQAFALLGIVFASLFASRDKTS